jgi:zinc protease
MVRFNLDDDYFDRYADRIRSLSTTQISSAAEEILHPDHLVWVVVGDREVIEHGIRQLALGEIRLLDADGNRVN